MSEYNYNKKLTHSTTFFIGGFSAWSFDLFFGHILESSKITKQTTNLSYYNIIKNMTKQKGFIGLLDGYFPWGSLQSFFKGSFFSLGYSLSKNMLENNLDKKKVEIISGGFGGTFQGFFMNPLLLLKTRVITNPSFKNIKGSWNTTIYSTKLGKEIIKNEGISVLMKGSLFFSFKRTIDWTFRYFFAEKTLEIYKKYNNYKNNITNTQKNTCIFIGGIISAIMTTPIDTMVTLIQDNSKAGQKVKIFKLFNNVYKEKGFIQLFLFSNRGFVPRTLHVAFATVIMKTITDSISTCYNK